MVCRMKYGAIAERWCNQSLVQLECMVLDFRAASMKAVVICSLTN